MPTLTVTATLVYGDTTPDGAVPCREPLSFTLPYTEASIKTVQIPASSVDFPIAVDTVGAPKFLYAKAELADVTVKVTNGIVLTPTPTSLAAEAGWLMFANPNGQAINALLVTTPASPASGARVKVIAFE